MVRVSSLVATAALTAFAGYAPHPLDAFGGQLAFDIGMLRTGVQLGGGLTEADEGDYFIRLKDGNRRRGGDTGKAPA